MPHTALPGFGLLLCVWLGLFLAGCARGIYVQKVEVPESKVAEVAQKRGWVKVPQTPFKIGETLEYQVSWNGIPVGLSALQVKEVLEYEGHRVYHMVLRIESNRFLSAFYRVEDEFHTYIDADGLFTRRYEQKLHHGRKYHPHEVVTFDPDKGEARYESLTNGTVKTFPIPKGAQDGLSIIYYYRTQPLWVGTSFKAPVEMDEKMYDVEIRPVLAEVVAVPRFGKFDSFRILPQATLLGKYVKKGTMTLWVTSDDRRIPLAASMNTKLGGILVVLSSMHEGPVN